MAKDKSIANERKRKPRTACVPYARTKLPAKKSDMPRTSATHPVSFPMCGYYTFPAPAAADAGAHSQGAKQLDEADRAHIIL